MTRSRASTTQPAELPSEAVVHLRSGRAAWVGRVRAGAAAKAASPAARGIPLVVALGAIVCFALHGVRAWRFPWPLDYGEGPLLDQAKRIGAGTSLYLPTFGRYNGLVSNYPPVYPCLFALAGKVFGFSFATGRAIAAAAACACAGLIGALVRNVTGRDRAALISVALFVASPAVFFWSMFARVDFVALAFSLGALLFVVRRPRAPSTPFVAAMLSVLAIFTRQSHLLAGPLAIAGALWLVSARRALGFLAMVALGTGCVAAALQVTTHGGFWLHVVTANVQPYHFAVVVDAGRRLLLSSAPLVAVSVWWLVSGRTPGRGGARGAQVGRTVMSLFFVGTLLSMLTVGKVGSAVNHLIPLIASLALLGGIAFACAIDVDPPVRAGRWLASRAAAAFVVVQLPWMVLFGMDLAERTDQKLRLEPEFAQLAAILRSEHGPVVADEGEGLVVLAGHEMAVDPFDLTQLTQEGAAVQEPLVGDLKAKRFGLVLVHEPPTTPESSMRERWTPEMLEAIHRAYEARGVLAWATLYRPRR